MHLRQAAVSAALTAAVFTGLGSATFTSASASTHAKACAPARANIIGRWQTETRRYGNHFFARFSAAKTPDRHCLLTTTYGGLGLPKPSTMTFHGVRAGSGALQISYNFSKHPNRIIVNDGSRSTYPVYRMG